MEQLLLNPEQAAELIGVGRNKLFQLLRAGEITSVRIGRSRRIPRASLEKYVERLTIEQTPRSA